MTWKKGTSGNPKGRPKSYETMAELIREELGKPYAGSQTYKERLAAVVVSQAARGNLAALAWLVDRTEGKVKDVQDLNVTGAVELVPWGPKPDAEA